MSDTLDKAALTAAEAFSKILTSMSLMVDKMTTLVFQGGLGLGRLIDAGINKVDLLVTEYGTYDMPPPPDEKAEVFLNAENPKKTFAYFTYCELVYKDKLSRAENAIKPDEDKLKDLQELEETSSENLPSLKIAIDAKKTKLEAAKEERDRHYPGTDGLYEHYDAEVKRIRDKELSPIVKEYDSSHNTLHTTEYMVRIGSTDVPLSLKHSIARLESSLGSRRKEVKKLRKNYELTVKARRQYEERLGEQKRAIPNEISVQEAKKTSECNGVAACIAQCDSTVKGLNDTLKKVNDELLTFPAQSTEAYSAFGETISSASASPPAVEGEAADEQKPAVELPSLKDSPMSGGI